MFSICINFLLVGTSETLALAGLTRVNDYQFVIEPNTFDFDYQSEASFSRNAGTFVGGAIFGRFFNTKYVFNLQPNMFIGGAFKVIFNGLITIPK